VKLRFTEKADKDYARMPPLIRKAFAKQLRFLLENRSHPPCMPRSTVTPWMSGRRG
jgi:mRNA-degrading endonuclease RelE of RelBE toxin-antitoxin system